jgi:hypothetical protein
MWPLLVCLCGLLCMSRSFSDSLGPWVLCVPVARQAFNAGHAEGLKQLPDEKFVASKMYNPQYFPLVSAKDYV